MFLHRIEKPYPGLQPDKRPLAHSAAAHVRGPRDNQGQRKVDHPWSLPLADQNRLRRQSLAGHKDLQRSAVIIRHCLEEVILRRHGDTLKRRRIKSLALCGDLSSTTLLSNLLWRARL